MPIDPSAAGGAFIVIPIHNRRDITLKCLARLRATGVMNWAKIIIVDDASTDGTFEAVSSAYPEVLIPQGDGNLWWTGGIVMGMKEAMRLGAKTIVWMNNDCLVREGTLEMLVNHTVSQGCISVGLTFGCAACFAGFRKTARGLKPVSSPPGSISPCDCMAGNCVAFPAGVVEKIGYPDAEHLIHVLADVDYGLRAKEAGYEIFVLGDALSDDHISVAPRYQSWLFDGGSMRKHWDTIMKPSNGFYPPANWHFYTRHWGPWGAVIFLRPYVKFFAYHLVRAILPESWLRAFFEKRSMPWKTMQIYKDLENSEASETGKRKEEPAAK